ncbi:unnamed protein product [Camellia sinensis]
MYEKDESGPSSLSSHLEESATERTCPSTSMVYDSLEADLKLNDVFEFVGVLTFDLEPSVDKDDSDEFTSTLCKDELSHSPPSKDYETNRLVSGVLQLAEGSHIMIDETHLQAGTLNFVGVENVLLEAIDLILQGAQNLVSNSRRKLQESPTAHNGCEFC